MTLLEERIKSYLIDNLVFKVFKIIILKIVRLILKEENKILNDHHFLQKETKVFKLKILKAKQ